MVATAAQIRANRANALRSTGPRSPEGKAASSRNALTHGAYAADDTILATSSDTYLEDFRAHFQPVGVLEAHLVDHLAVLASRRERLNAAMDALLELNERHALTECLHERYGINQPNTYIPGQPSWQAPLRRYDENTCIDDLYPEPVSDPALDPDPILCSLAYTLSGPRAAALFRHEASVDRRFSVTLKDLSVLQARRQAAAEPASSAAPRRKPGHTRTFDRYLHQTPVPAGPSIEPSTPPATEMPAHPASHAGSSGLDPSSPHPVAPPLPPTAASANTRIEANAPAIQSGAGAHLARIEANAAPAYLPATLLDLLPRLTSRPAGLYRDLLEDLLPPPPTPKPRNEAGLPPPATNHAAAHPVPHPSAM